MTKDVKRFRGAAFEGAIERPREPPSRRDFGLLGVSPAPVPGAPAMLAPPPGLS